MRVTIFLSPEYIDYGKMGKIKMFPFFINLPLKVALKRVGWKRLWRIRRITIVKPLKQKWTIEAYNDMKILHGIDIHKELENAIQKEMLEAKERDEKRKTNYYDN